MSRGRRSRPVMPAEAEAGLRPTTCMHVMPEAGGQGAFLCMHARGRGPAEGGAIGRDSRPSEACFVRG
eukprot:353394-Chlamydomonas_euryale.AAC.14